MPRKGDAVLFRSVVQVKESIKSSYLEYQDNRNDTTYSRRIAKYLSRFSWYNPPSQHETSLDAGWAYFEHVTLPRRHISEGKIEKAKPGDTGKSNLYSVWTTTEDDLGSFGLGVGLYFSTLKYLTWTSLLAGLVLLYNMVFFSSAGYSGEDRLNSQGFRGTIRDFVFEASAVCTDVAWKPCSGCNADDWNYFPYAIDRYVYVPANDGGDDLKFILVNNCKIDFFSGFFWLVAFGLVAACVGLINLLRKKREVELDVSQQTASDYSLEVRNPPKDALDVGEWRSFFSQFGEAVTCVTVAVDNQDLTRALVRRRKLLYDLERRLPEGFEFDLRNPPLEEAMEVAWPLAWYERLMLYSSPEKLKEEIEDLNKVIEGQKSRSCDAASVFVTFETEEAQRQALSTLSISKKDAYWKNTSAVPESCLFRGEHLLKVREPGEPEALRWLEMCDTRMHRLLLILKMTFFHLLFIAVGSYIVLLLRLAGYGPAVAAFAVTGANILSQYLVSYFVNKESHPTEGSKQASLYVKATASLWFQTTMLTAYITPWADRLSDGDNGMVRTLYALFVFEILRGPIMQMVDISGQVNRHFFAPRAPDQRRMNLCFLGTSYTLAERYKSMTNILFLTFYYSSIFPAGFLLAALALGVHYWADKFCLLRSWTQVPPLGSSIAKFSGHFLLAALVFFVVVSTYMFAGFPFDNACPLNAAAPEEYVGDFVAYDFEGNEVEISVDNDEEYLFCNQDLFSQFKLPLGNSWEGLGDGEAWMTEDQDLLVFFCALTAFIFVSYFVLRVVFTSLFEAIYGIFASPYEPDGEASTQKFSEVKGIRGYIPQVKISGYPFPVLLCSIDAIDLSLIGWKSPAHGHEHYNLIHDIPGFKETGLTHFAITKNWVAVKADDNDMADDNNMADGDNTTEPTETSEPVLC